MFSPTDLTTWISIISAIAACFAAWFAYTSAQVAKKSLFLSEQQEASRRPILKPYLSAAYFKKSKAKDSKTLAFSMSISNSANSANSIVHLELEIRYVTATNVCMKIRIQHEGNLTSDFGSRKIEPFKIPTSIGSHQAVAGWALFDISGPLLGGGVVESYTIIFTDSHGIVTALEAGIPKEVLDV